MPTPHSGRQRLQEQAQTINYFNTGSPGEFDSDKPFPGTTMNTDVENFVILVKGKVLIPQTGNWTFGVSSDDGYSMTLTKGAKTYTSAYPDPRGPASTLTVFNIAEAGSHDLRLVFYEQGGGSELELFAARGSFTSFSAANFRLVGDVAGGGLEVGAGNVWYTNSFNDSSWTLGTGGVGFETGTGYEPYFDIDVQSQMYNINGGCYIRIPFTVDEHRVLQHDAQGAIRRRICRLPQRRRSRPAQRHGRSGLELHRQHDERRCGRCGADHHRYLRLCRPACRGYEFAGRPRHEQFDRAAPTSCSRSRWSRGRSARGRSRRLRFSTRVPSR